MMIEVMILGILLYVILEYNGSISTNKFIMDNQDIFKKLKEKDYDFYAKARYGDSIDVEALFNARLKNGLIVIFLLIFAFISKLSYVNCIFAVIVGYGVYKLNYLKLRKYYKTHLHEIDIMLPYYLKNLEILVQHYTVPVALGKSVDEAPEIFRSGLNDLIAKINAGDSTINPYMDFARDFPVRDSMRMMRLLYRLGLGSNENKQEQLMMFSKTVSTLQNKSREQKYKERLEKMEGKTMMMLGGTGGGILLFMLMAMYMMMGTS